MSTYEELSRRLDDADAAMHVAEDRLGNFRTMAATLAELVGRAESDDGHVVVEWTSAGLSVLDLDPRAMRLPSADLAAAIRATVTAAMADLREQTRAAIAGFGLGPDTAPTPEQVREQLADLRRLTMGGARQAAADIDRAEQVRRRGAWG